MPTKKPEFRQGKPSPSLPHEYRLDEETKEKLTAIVPDITKGFLEAFEYEVNGYFLLQHTFEGSPSDGEVVITLKDLKERLEATAALSEISSKTRVRIIDSLINNYGAPYEEASAFIADTEKRILILAKAIDSAIESKPPNKAGNRKDIHKAGLIHRLAIAFKKHQGNPTTSRNGTFELVVKTALTAAGTYRNEDLHRMIVKAVQNLSR